MGLIHSPRIVTDKMVLYCDGPNKRTFNPADQFPTVWTFGNTDSTYDSTIDNIAYGNNTFVGVVGDKWVPGTTPSNTVDNKQIQYSTDGSSWTAIDEPDRSMWTSICYGRDHYQTDRFVGVAYTIGSGSGLSTCAFMTSETGTSNWVAVNIDSGTGSQKRNWHAIACPPVGSGVSAFVAVGSNGAVTRSIFGYTYWTEETATENNDWFDVCWGDTTEDSNGKFVAISYDGSNRVMYSTDKGNTWSNSNITGVVQTNQWRAITHGGGKFVMVGGSRVGWSTDAITWNDVVPSLDGYPDGTARTFYGVDYGNGYYIAYGGNHVSGTGNIWYSVDAINWKPIIPNIAGVAVTSRTWGDSSRASAYGNGKFVISATEIDHNNPTGEETIIYTSISKSTTWNDISARNNHITVHGASFSEPDNSIIFDGQDNYASCLSNSDVSFGTGEFAVEVWVKLNALDFDSGIYRPVWDTRTATTNDDGLYLYANYNGSWELWDDGIVISGYNKTGGSAVINTWYHITITRKEGLTFLYVNGVYVGSFTDTNDYNNDDLIIGKRVDGNTYLDGNIGMIKIYKGRGLSSNQVNQHYFTTKSRYS